MWQTVEIKTVFPLVAPPNPAKAGVLMRGTLAGLHACELSGLARILQSTFPLRSNFRIALTSGFAAVFVRFKFCPLKHDAPLTRHLTCSARPLVYSRRMKTISVKRTNVT